MSKNFYRIIPVAIILLFGTIGIAGAQGFSPFFGMGSAFDSAGTSSGCPNGYLFDDFSGFCEPGPTMGGVFGIFGGDLMLKPHLGFNAEYAFRFAQANYLPDVGLKYRPSFYDFNAVYEPITGTENKIVPVLTGGIGGARIELYEAESVSVTGITSNVSYPAGISANHFQVHGSGGVRFYFNGNLFLEPRFDVHYVRNLNQQFGRNVVPQFMVSIGYSFGNR